VARTLESGVAVLAFLDTEFTDLVFRPRLLSVGVVTERGTAREFYAEVTDPDRLRATGWFGQGAVLPQFGKVAGAACSWAELGCRLLSFLGELSAGLTGDACVELAFGHRLDWELVDAATQHSAGAGWAAVRRRVRPVNIYEFTGFDAGHLASEAYFKAQAGALLSHHHALCDARALRVAYEAALQALAAPGERGGAGDGPPMARPAVARTTDALAGQAFDSRSREPWC
jgi:hypothetical protein